MSSSRLPIARLASTLAMFQLVLACSAPAHAFDGQRKGFVLGAHVGVMGLKQSYPAGYHGFRVGHPDSMGSTRYVPYSGGTRWIGGTATQLSLGWGFSESARLSVINQVHRDIAEDGNTANTRVAEGSLGLCLDVYPGGADAPWSGSIGLGVGAADGPTGGAFQLSLGRDLTRAIQLQLTLFRYGTANDHNVGGQLLLGWLVQ